jgi:hypothetical protein
VLTVAEVIATKPVSLALLDGSEPGMCSLVLFGPTIPLPVIRAFSTPVSSMFVQLKSGKIVICLRQIVKNDPILKFVQV